MLSQNVDTKNHVDTLKVVVDNLRSELSQLKSKTDEIRNGQLNYSVEKELLKETYSSNFEKLNFVLTAMLGVGGLLTFFGLRDVTSIKKDFKSELEAMRQLKTEFENKSKNFDIEKDRFDSEIKKIITQNEEQNKKIKVLELKEKVNKLMDDKQNTSAYEYCTIALELAPDDVNLSTNKAMLLCRLNNFPEAVEVFEKIYNQDRNNETSIGNLLESLYFFNKIEKANEILALHSDYNEDKKPDGFVIFRLIDYFHNSEEETFKKYIIKLIDVNDLKTAKKRINWGLTESLYFAAHQATSKNKTYLQNILWYLEGQANAETVFKRIGVNLTGPSI